MPTFIDESGDTGVYGNGGTAFFHLAAAWVPSLDVADEFRWKVRRLRKALNLKSTYEFKFANTHNHPERRAAFFDAASAIEFRFAASSIDKSDPYWNRGEGPEQHWACATELSAILRPIYLMAERDKGAPLREHVIVDDNGDRNYLAIVKRQFRGLESGERPGSKLVGPVDFRKSHPEEMLQMVDMICGAVGARDDPGQVEWYERIRCRDLQPSGLE